jgi:hypothetical protein
MGDIQWKFYIISTDEDPGLWIETIAVINLHGVSTNKKYYKFDEYPHARVRIYIYFEALNSRIYIYWRCAYLQS